jgi:hypothetical protein
VVYSFEVVHAIRYKDVLSQFGAIHDIHLFHIIRIVLKMDRHQALRPTIRARDPVVKGASKLDLMEFPRYDTSVVHDDLAKRSKKFAILHDHADGDRDVWVEKLYASTKTGKVKVYFVSKKTGKKIEGEPPSGASRVLYLKESYKERNLTSPTRSKSFDEK